MKNEHQQIIGYITGGTIVLLIIPFGIFNAAKYLDQFIGIQLFQSDKVRLGLAALLFISGGIFGIWSIVIQNVIGKGGPVQIGMFDISPKTQNLVVSGPYKYTRNPMLFGACMMYFAFSVYLNSAAALIMVILFMIFMLIFVKLSEEKRLLKDFGKPYEEYRRRTSMFIPWFPKK